MLNQIDIAKKGNLTVRQDIKEFYVNKINGQNLDDFIFNRIMQRTDPIYYCETVLRAHLPEKKKHLHENQIELIRAVCNPTIRKVAGLMARQAGKCFAEGTLIMMADGKSKKVEDIRVGDFVMSPNSTPVEVIELGQGYEEMYEICTNEKNYKNFIVNGSHILAVKDKQNKINKITVNDYLKLTSERQNELFGYRVSVDFKKQPISINPYYFGLWLGSGRNNYSEIINIDNEVIKYIEQYTKELNMQFSVFKNKNDSINFCAIINGNKDNTNYIIDELKKLNVYNNKHIPDEYMYNDINIRKQVLAGLIDSNGYIDEDCMLEFIFTNEKLTNDVLKLLRLCGYRATIKEKLINLKSKECVAYKIIADGDFTDVPTKVQKKQFIKKPQYDWLQFNFTIKPKGIGKYYGFVIKSKDHLFLLDDCTVVHNTESIASFSGYLIDNYPQMRVGIFTPRVQQAEVNVGRVATFYQMNEDKLNNKLIRCNKQKIELSNGSFIMAVSGSDQSNIEGLTFDVIVLDEAQKISDYTWSERIMPMGGACVVGSTLITLLDGTQQTIESIVKNKNIKKLPCIDIKNECMTVGKITQFCDVGLKKTIKIILNSGKTIEGTYEHPLLLYKDKKIQWERLDKLKIKDKICVPNSIPYFGQYNEENARLLGMLIGNGSYGYKNTITFNNADDELWDYIKNKCIDSNIHTQYIAIDNRLYQEASIIELKPLLKQIGINKQTKLNKILSKNWQIYNKQSLQELIAGLYDTNGNIQTPKDNKFIIEFSSICLNIVQDLQTILLKFGIHSNIRKQNIKDKVIQGRQICSKQYYILQIRYRYNIQRFYDNFKLLVQSKQNKLDYINEFYKTYKKRNNKNFYNDDIYLEEIVSIEYSENYVYDLTIDKYHSFIANNIFSHNTNAKMIKIGTPKTRNHFFKSFQIDEENPKNNWCCIKRDWTQCPQLWALDATMLPDPETGILRPYSTYVLSLMPKALKQEMFPNNPEMWYEGEMSIEDFKTQYMLEFVDGLGKFLGYDDFNRLRSGDFEWLSHGQIGEEYFAGIDFAGSGAATADFTHITVIRKLPNGNKQKVFAKEMQGVPYPEQMRIISNMFGGYQPQFICKKILADYTGVGRPVIDSLIYEFGMYNLVGITFNSRDIYTHSGMNMKNVMFAQIRKDIENGRFQYPNKEMFLKSAGKDLNGFYHKMLGEWADLEQEQRLTVNKIIQAPNGGHDDCVMADILANFATIIGSNNRMPKVSSGRIGSYR